VNHHHAPSMTATGANSSARAVTNALSRVFERVRLVPRIDAVAVITGNLTADEPVAAFKQTWGRFRSAVAQRLIVSLSSSFGASRGRWFGLRCCCVATVPGAEDLLQMALV
jgi:hypothetical protein